MLIMIIDELKKRGRNVFFVLDITIKKYRRTQVLREKDTLTNIIIHDEKLVYVSQVS